jgi:hypothetical protein
MSYKTELLNKTGGKLLFHIKNYKDSEDTNYDSLEDDEATIISSDVTVFNLTLIDGTPLAKPGGLQAFDFTSRKWQGAVPSNEKIIAKGNKKDGYKVFINDEEIPAQVINLNCSPNGNCSSPLSSLAIVFILAIVLCGGAFVYYRYGGARRRR